MKKVVVTTTVFQRILYGCSSVKFFSSNNILPPEWTYDT